MFDFSNGIIQYTCMGNHEFITDKAITAEILLSICEFVFYYGTHLVEKLGPPRLS